MKIQQELYNEIKNINLEYDKTLELDKEYLHLFCKINHNELNLTNFMKEYYNNNNNLDNLVDDNNIYIERKCINLYRKLAKIVHPDKNINYHDLFIKINIAYRKNDYITLFMYSYEYNIKIILNNDEISAIKNNILKKQNEIKDIKDRFYWKWYNSNCDFEKAYIVDYVKQHL
jgi:hypothetical protein